MIRMAFKYRLRPNGEQRRRMKRVAGSCRFVYNQALRLQRERLDEDGRRWSYAELCRALTEWKRDADTAWLSEAPSHTLQQSLRDLCRAFTNRFEHGAGLPRFRRKGRRESFRYPDSKQFHLDQGNSRVFLPKLGWMRYRNSRAVEGRLRNITVSERCGEWYMSIQVEVDLAIGRHEGGVVGLDLGIVRFATLSDGTHYEPLNSFRRHQDRLRLAQRSLSRKVRGSRSWKRQKLRVAKVHARIADVRSDYLHKISHTVSKNHAVVCLEDLQVKRMSASARGTRDEPGRHVKAKSVLNRAILDQGWGEFRRQLEYKTHWLLVTKLNVPLLSRKNVPHLGHFGFRRPGVAEVGLIVG